MKSLETLQILFRGRAIPIDVIQHDDGQSLGVRYIPDAHRQCSQSEPLSDRQATAASKNLKAIFYDPDIQGLEDAVLLHAQQKGIVIADEGLPRIAREKELNISDVDRWGQRSHVAPPMMAKGGYNTASHHRQQHLAR